MLNAIKEKSPHLHPSTIITDFELAAKNAFRKAFPNAQQHGCFFHFGQCFYRKIQKIPEVLEKYSDESDPDYALKVKCISALAFVPPNIVRSTFEELITDPFYSSSDGSCNSERNGNGSTTSTSNQS